jgi:hypothetical protein
VSFYRKNREAFHERKHQLPPEHAREVREIEFEQFVLDQPFRRNVIDWLLEGGSAQRVRRRFEPERSAKNIGIYARLLARDEREAIEKELARWRRS